MTAALAILGDSLRLLRARKLFGISMWISIFVALGYASVGFDSEGVTFLFGLQKWREPMMAEGSDGATALYTLLFTDVIVRYWLGWVVLLLAFISVVPTFPDFLSEGSVGVTLSKPVGRVRIFLLKYLGSLLFVAMQVGFFAIIVFLAMGLRTGEWNPRVFWSVPLVVFVFSLIYCVAVLAAVWTRSTAFSLLAGLGIWGMSLLVSWGEDVSYKMGEMFPAMGAQIDLTSGRIESAESGSGETARKWHKHFKSLATVFPKTRDCTHYMKRMVTGDDQESVLSGVSFDGLVSGATDDPTIRRVSREYETRHSLWYMFGTSAVFEIVVLGAALVIFCRRDF